MQFVPTTNRLKISQLFSKLKKRYVKLMNLPLLK